MTMGADTSAGSPGTSAERPAAAVQSVDRALLVMEILARRGQAGVTELAAELGVHKSTVSRLVAALEARGYVEQISERGPYRLGYSITRLARASGGEPDLARVGQDVCDGLAAEVAETVNVAILDGDRIINIAEAIGPAEITLRSWVGQTCPAHATSSGKALLAWTADVQVRLGDPLQSFTDRTVVEFAELGRQLVTARERGWASVSEELEVGLNAVAAPIRDANAEVVAALSVSGPSYRLPKDRFEEIAKRAIGAADVISRRLGWVDRDAG
jgi:DNA-binding IclR family transcriptional regulator